ncbi:ABC transporter substrate-binding protein [Aliiroseovarius sp. N1F302]|uniref:MlaC/ttg2D family ABC transporter substrate-binding protein n=2 Tax=Aliiroseovarius TaxID=1658781 RepID=UPI001F578B7D|nr:ABC transporter substrate-binding protein [Aliiroseovarius sediminis]MCI2395493.1 ABC transporter substrate-binding protein [Aliiroseovarius sediminis]
MMGNQTSLTRRAMLGGLAGLGVMALLPGRALAAISADRAESLIDQVVSDINGIINSGASEGTMIKRFENVFAKYADVNFIALSALGPDGRSASASQKAAFVKAFRAYVARRYGSRFREFQGGSINVVNTKQVKSRYEVMTQTQLRGKSPFDVVFVVSAKNGKFIDMQVEGISIVKSERKEIGAMLDRRGGDLNKLIADLK